MTRHLFDVGLQLLAMSQVADDPTRRRLETAVTHIDSSIVALRHAIFPHSQDPPSPTHR